MKNTTLLYLALLFIVFSGCEKEETLKINITDSTNSPYYLSLIADGEVIEKDLIWYRPFSFYFDLFSSWEQEFRMQYTWQTPFSSSTSHYLPGYYDNMKEGFVGLELYDSTLLEKIVGSMVSSDQYGENMNFRMAFANKEKGWESVGSVFDFRINNIKDTIVEDNSFSLPRQQKYKIISLDIPNIQMRQIEDTTNFIEVKDIKMRFPVSYTR